MLRFFAVTVGGLIVENRGLEEVPSESRPGVLVLPRQCLALLLLLLPALPALALPGLLVCRVCRSRFFFLTERGSVVSSRCLLRRPCRVSLPHFVPFHVSRVYRPAPLTPVNGRSTLPTALVFPVSLLLSLS